MGTKIFELLFKNTVAACNIMNESFVVHKFQNKISSWWFFCTLPIFWVVDFFIHILQWLNAYNSNSNSNSNYCNIVTNNTRVNHLIIKCLIERDIRMIYLTFSMMTTEIYVVSVCKSRTALRQAVLTILLTAAIIVPEYFIFSALKTRS